MLQRRRAWLGAVIPAIMMAVVTCNDDTTTATPDARPVGPPGALGASTCPDAAPRVGESCLLPEGTTCAFGACNTTIAQCSFGSWRFGGSPPVRAACPVDFPVSGEACPACFSPEVSCTYGSENCAVSANRSVARCEAGVWDIKTTACSINDAGADVQRDAGPDSD